MISSSADFLDLNLLNEGVHGKVSDIPPMLESQALGDLDDGFVSRSRHLGAAAVHMGGRRKRSIVVPLETPGQVH